MTIFTSKRLRVIKTCNLYISSVASGMSMAIAGPTLLDLQHVVKTDTNHIGFVYTGRSSGYLLGSIIGGIVFDLTPRKQFLMTIFNCLVAISMFAIPFSRSIGILTAWMVLNGTSMGALDTGLNVCCLNLWGKDSGPFYQALHFAYGFGGLIAPLVAAPFLGQYLSQDPMNINTLFINQSTQEDIYPNNSYYTSSTVIPEGFSPNTTVSVTVPALVNTFQNNSHSSSPAIPAVFYAYAIIGSVALLVTSLFFAVCIIAPLDEMAHKTDKQLIKKRGKMFVGILVGLNFLLVFVETGTEIGYAQMVATYSVKGPLKLTPAIGSYMTSTFWGAFTVSRFSAIFLSIRFSNLSLILSHILVTSVGAAVLLFLSSTKEWALWLASVLLGFGIAPLFATEIAWIEQYITITNKFVALFATGAAFGEMVLPYMITHYIEEVPIVLCYVVTGSCVLSCLLIFCMYMILRNKQDKYQTKEGISNAVCDTTLDGSTTT